MKQKIGGMMAVLFFIAPVILASSNPYRVRTFEENGGQIDVIVVPGRPPAVKAAVAVVPKSNKSQGINVLGNVPAFTWCYGCSPTAAAMLMGYYDNHGYTEMYTGPANGGVCPMNNDLFWGYGESPLSATHIGKDGRNIRGHVEDYWIAYNNPGPDPCIVNNWTEHTAGDCTADYMGTSQSKFSNADGNTVFYFYNSGRPLYDYSGCEPANRDGCHGLKLFANSRGYTVTANFSQYIYGYNGNTNGATFATFTGEIDAGRPVLIHVNGHTMLGYGYNETGSIVYIHDTWDNSDHSMTWGGYYSGMQHYGIGVFRLQPLCTVSFDGQGGLVPVPLSRNVSVGSPYGPLSVTTRDGYSFAGWWTEPGGGGEEVLSSTIVTNPSSHTLYASWALATTTRKTPHAWLDQYDLVIGSDYEAADLEDVDGDGYAAWAEYVAGTCPTSRTSIFRSLITLDNGIPLVTWFPDLGTTRVYVVEGRTNLTSGTWGPTNAGTRYYHTKVRFLP